MKKIAFTFILLFTASAYASEIPQVLRDLGVKFRMTGRNEVDYLSPFKKLGKHEKPVKEFEFLYFGQSLRSILREVQAQSPENEIVLDCAYFAQIASIILRGDLDRANFFLVTSPLSIWTLSGYQKSRAAYVSLVDDNARQLIASTPLINKGQWLLEVGPDRYLGLADQGMQVDSEANWIQITRKGLFAEMDFELQSGSRLEDITCENMIVLSWWRRFYARLADVHRRKGSLEHWTLQRSAH